MSLETESILVTNFKEEELIIEDNAVVKSEPPDNIEDFQETLGLMMGEDTADITFEDHNFFLKQETEDADSVEDCTMFVESAQNTHMTLKQEKEIEDLDSMEQYTVLVDSAGNIHKTLKQEKEIEDLDSMEQYTVLVDSAGNIHKTLKLENEIETPPMNHKATRRMRSCYVALESLPGHINKVIKKAKAFNPKPLLPCQYCYKKFRLESSLRGHEMGHTWFQCRHCSQEFQLSHDLYIHESTHKEVKNRFKCSICLMTFTSEKALNRHSIKHVIICQCCPKVTTSLTKFRRHVRTHPTNSLVCKLCLKVCKDKNELTIHIRTHEVTRVCYYCSFMSPDFCFMKKHQLAHANIQPYHCKYCLKPAGRLIKLIKHETLHGYVCKFCQQMFKTMKILREHEGKHLSASYKRIGHFPAARHM